jgi:hypothetical protein
MTDGLRRRQAAWSPLQSSVSYRLSGGEVGPPYSRAALTMRCASRPLATGHYLFTRPLPP